MKPRILTTFLSGAAVIAVAAGLSLGAPAPAPVLPKPPADMPPLAAPKPKEDKERGLLIQGGKKSHAVYDDTTGLLVITNFDTIELPDSDAVLVAARVEYNDKERWARATGKPRMWDARNEITGDTMYVDLNAKRIDIKGTVRMVVRPKESKNEDSKKFREQMKEPVVINCDQVEYFYAKETKRGTATGHLQLFQKNEKADRTATAERLSYDGIEETVTLEDNVAVRNTRGEEFECDTATISVKEGAEGFNMEGVRRVKLLVRDEVTDSKEKKGEPPAEAPKAP